MSFETALTGLKAAGADLEVISNNVANVATIGFKRSDITFGDVFSSTNIGSTQGASGQGVRVTNIRQSFGQGDITYTDRQLDLSIAGSGFFRLNDNGSIAYSRAGSFTLHRDGYIVNSLGHHLTGFPADAEGRISTIAGDLQLSTLSSPPNQTSSVVLDVNLGSEQLVPPPFDVDNRETHNFSTSTMVYDALGTSYLMTMYFRKAADNVWEMHTYQGDEKIGSMDGDVLEFDSDGLLETINGVDATNGVDVGFDRIGMPGERVEVNVQLTDSTQYDNPSFSVSDVYQNGYQAGRLNGFDINPDGIIYGQFSNGHARALGQLALTDFNNPRGLRQVHNTSWIETFDSGAAVTGVPGTGTLGTIQSSSLEESNIDLAQELVRMIGTQRNFQANAQVITANDTIVQTVINIRR
jgi:flagellar hook protein FlgE